MKKSWQRRREAKSKALTVKSQTLVNSPPHYTKGKFETIDVLEDIVQHYTDPVEATLVWNTIKYIARAPHKEEYSQDLKKAQWYLNRLVSRGQ